MPKLVGPPDHPCGTPFCWQRCARRRRTLRRTVQGQVLNISALHMSLARVTNTRSETPRRLHTTARRGRRRSELGFGRCSAFVPAPIWPQSKKNRRYRLDSADRVGTSKVGFAAIGAGSNKHRQNPSSSAHSPGSFGPAMNDPPNGHPEDIPSGCPPPTHQDSHRPTLGRSLAMLGRSSTTHGPSRRTVFRM